MQLLDGKRGIGIHAPVTLGMGAFCRLDQRGRVLEFRHEAVDAPGHQSTFSQSTSTFASGSIVRISKIEIIGRKRRKRNSSARNRPMVPANVEMSHRVGAN